MHRSIRSGTTTRSSVQKRGDDTTVKTLEYKRKVKRNLRKTPKMTRICAVTNSWIVWGGGEWGEGDTLNSAFSAFSAMTSPSPVSLNVHLYIAAVLQFWAWFWFDDVITVVKFDSGFNSFVAMRLHAFLCQKELSMSKLNTCYEYIERWRSSARPLFCLSILVSEETVGPTTTNIYLCFVLIAIISYDV